MGRQDAGGSGISEEEWQRFGEEIARESAQAPKEPSARARMVTERLRREEQERARAAGRRGALGRRGRRTPGDPPGWRTGPSWQEAEDRRRRRRGLRATAAIVGIAALALVVVRPELLIDRLTGKTEAREAGAGAPPLPGESVRPTAAPDAAHPDRPTPEEPFRGSPAARWADGAAGIEVPEAAATGGWSREAVADALSKAKRFLVAANLDPRTVRGERPEAAMALLDPRQPEVPERLERSLTQPGGGENSPAILFTRFDPAEVQPVGHVVKVRGSMRAEAGDPGELLVVTDYTFVHPMARADRSVQRTIVRRQITFSVLDPARWRATAGRLQLHTYKAEWSNVRCEPTGGFLHPDFPQDRPGGTQPSGPATDPYDRSGDIQGDGCGTVTRS